MKANQHEAPESRDQETDIKHPDEDHQTADSNPLLSDADRMLDQLLAAVEAEIAEKKAGK